MRRLGQEGETVKTKTTKDERTNERKEETVYIVVLLCDDHSLMRRMCKKGGWMNE